MCKKTVHYCNVLHETSDRSNIAVALVKNRPINSCIFSVYLTMITVIFVKTIVCVVAINFVKITWHCRRLFVKTCRNTFARQYHIRELLPIAE